MLQSIYNRLGNGRILWHDLSTVKWTLRFCTWNARSLYRAGLFKTVAKELGKYNLDLVGVQEVRWEKGALKCSVEMGMKIIS
jgi:hypothetical protein